MSESEPRHAAVKTARGPRHVRGRARGTGVPGTPGTSTGALPLHDSNALQRNRTYAVISALPVLMLMIGLTFSYLSERRQSTGAPIESASVQLAGAFDGFTRVGIGAKRRHTLWLRTEERRRGVRVQQDEVGELRATLSKGQGIVIDAAPSVEGSRTRWLWRLRRDGVTLLDDGERLR